MSAIAWHSGETQRAVRPSELPSPEQGRRPHRHLVSVPTGDAVRESAPAPLRPTRRGRLVLLLSALVVVLVFGIAIAAGSSASVADHAVTVRSGQTLSEIAVREMPGLPMREAVARIQIANDLPSSHISAGQSLVIPKY